jgi:hypothetical protein
MILDVFLLPHCGNTGKEYIYENNI